MAEHLLRLGNETESLACIEGCISLSNMIGFTVCEIWLVARVATSFVNYCKPVVINQRG